MTCLRIQHRTPVQDHLCYIRLFNETQEIIKLKSFIALAFPRFKIFHHIRSKSAIDRDEKT